jgi:diaminopimelate epimerase
MEKSVMGAIEFWKMNGSGNDFVLIDNRDGVITDEALPRLVERICRRRTSVGADGVILVSRSDEFDFAWRYLNADGGEVEMCGNGARCVSRFAVLKGIAAPELVFETLAGPVSAEVRGRMVKVLMPKPSGFVKDMDLPPQAGWKTVDFINTGVPHVVIGVQDLAHHPVLEQGRALRYHEKFAPEGTNANFMTMGGKDGIHVRTYERGVEDETLACGTGAIACALSASARGLVTSPVRVTTRGGEDLVIHFSGGPPSFWQVWLEGNTSIVYEGRLHDEAL